jgi:hypothetical protein
MLHRAVRDVRPSEGTLDHLRRAVPARRARKRQVAVGMAAAALFIGTAVPALVHVTDATGSRPDPAMAGQASQVQGGTGQGKNPLGGAGTTGGSSGPATDKGTGGKKDGRQHGTGATAPGSASGAGTPADPSAPPDTSAPVCKAAQLGSATAQVGAPDDAGAVYGSFRVTNISRGSCTVGGPGTVTARAQGAADQIKVTVVQHTVGDPATALPAPPTEVSGLVLSPGSAYEVEFAWVPSDACPTSGGSDTDGTETGGPSPDPSPSKAGGATSGETTTTAAGTDSGTGGGGSGATTQLADEATPADGRVVVSHTPDAGSPAVSATVPDACAGTVYRTGLLAAS